MKKEKSYVLADVERKIRLLNLANYDYEIMKNANVPRTKLHEVRRQFHFATYKDALRRIIEEEIRTELKSYEYQELCAFLIENNFTSNIALIPDISLRLKFLKRVENQTDKARILASIDDDKLKMQYLSGFEKESDKLIVLCSLASDESKLNYFSKITDYHKQTQLIASLESDDLKLEYIFSGKIHSNTVGDVVLSLKDDSKKVDLLDLILSDTARFRVICTLKDDNLKEVLYEEKIRSENFKERKRPALILSLSLDEQLRRITEFDDGLKGAILQNCDFETQFKLLSLIKDESIKELVINRIPPEELLKYMAYSYGDTTNYWVRTDSEEREPNLPRDDRAEMVAQIVKFSTMSAKNKIEIIRTYVRDEEKTRELLAYLPYDSVISDYFNIKQKGVNIQQLNQINRIYDIESRCDVELTVDRNFDFDNPDNIDLINKVRKMKYPKLLLDKVPYEEFMKWQQIFENTDVIILPTSIDISNTSLSFKELQDLANISEQVIVDDSRIFNTKKYCKVIELVQDIFPLEEEQKFEQVRKEIEKSIYYGLLGNTLTSAEKSFDNAGFTSEEKQAYGERLLSGLYNKGQECGIIQRLGLSVEAVELLDRWDSSNSILKDNFENISHEMTKKGIKKAIDIMLARGDVTEDFAISYMLEYLSEQYVPQSGIEYAKKISKELLQIQDLNANDIEVLNPGAFSDVFLIGDYVIKIGLGRETKIVPKHDKILPSLLRFEVKEQGNAVSSFIEVQPKVRTISENQPFDEEIMYDIYASLRDDHIVWGDVAVRNIGFLDKKPNIPENLFARLKKELELEENVVTYHNESLSFENKLTNNLPQAYIMDTDFLYPIVEEDNQDLRIPSVISYEYEMRYQKEKARERAVDSSKFKKGYKKIQKSIDEIFGEIE